MRGRVAGCSAESCARPGTSLVRARQSPCSAPERQRGCLSPRWSGCGRKAPAQRCNRHILWPQALSSRLLSRAAAAAAAEEPPLSPGTTLLPEDTGPRGGRDLYRYIADELPWQRVTIWTVVAWLAYQLHDFFGIFMGTFILAFIGNSFVHSLSARGYARILPLAPVWRRRCLVLLYFTTIVSVVTLFGVLTIPDIIREGADFVSRLQSDNIWVVVLEKLRHGVGDGAMDQLERLMLVASGDELARTSGSSLQAWTAERTQYLGNAIQSMLRSYTDTAVNLTTGLLGFISRFAIQVGVSMVLSFMFVWDLPNIANGAASLQNSRLAPFYNELAPLFIVFGQLFGKALQAQARIAMVNTALTALGMYVLAIPGIGLQSLFVFICSFIPIAGCFISTIPIAFVALTEYGFFQLAMVILMVTGIHFIEAYVLNPAIYSAHLKLHPLLVLTVLVVAEHSLGVWGLLLAVPMTVFALDYCIRFPACSVTEIAAKELQTVSISEYSNSKEMLARFGVADPALLGPDALRAGAVADGSQWGD